MESTQTSESSAPAAEPSLELRALREHRYQGRQLLAGDSYTARSARDAKVMQAIGHAEPAPAETPASRKAAKAKAKAAEDDAADEAAADKKKASYSRRDLTAEK